MKKLFFLIAMLLSSTTTLGNEPNLTKSYEEALNSNKKALIIFSTDWCGYCERLKKDLKNTNTSNFIVCIVNAEKRNDLKKKYKVNSYPTSIIIENKKEIARKVGHNNKDYNYWLEKNNN